MATIVYKHSIPLKTLLGERALNNLVFQPLFDEKTAEPVFYLNEDGFISTVQICKVLDPIDKWEAILSLDIAKQYLAGEFIQQELLFLNEVITYDNTVTTQYSQARHCFEVSYENYNQPFKKEDDEVFPYVVLPPTIDSALTYMPPEKPFKQTIPIEPQGHPVKDSVYRLIVLSPFVFFSLLSYIIAIAIRIPALFILGIFTGTLGIILMTKWVIPKLNLVPLSEMIKKEEEYKRKKSTYERNMEGYDDAITRYETLSPLYGKCSRTEYFDRSISVCLKQYSPPTVQQNLSEVKQGPAEQMFIRFLSSDTKKDFELLGTVKAFHIFPDSEMAFYYPDVAIREKTTGLMIDIEIDEPYIAKIGTPIHYYGWYGGNNDNDRNEALSSDNWIIFHFSEEQIIRFPEICWAYVKSLCIGLRNRIEYEKPYSEGFYQKRWSYYEAQEMADSNYRLTYLPTNTWNSIRVTKRKSLLKEEDDDAPLPF